MDKSVSVLLTAYRRPEYLTEQIDAVRAQSVAPSEIVVWHNRHLDHEFPEHLFQGLPVISCFPNQGVWPRFHFCLNLKSRFVLVLDDDTIPGHRYLESCLNEFEAQPGIYGTVGLIHKGGVGDWRFMRYGWCYPNNTTQQVDMVGHSWFFERDWIRYYCLESSHGTMYSGEDYHLSFALYKHLGIKSYVPPHPEQDYSLWGSLKGAEYGGDQRALFLVPGQTDILSRTHQAYMEAGFMTLERQGIKVDHLF